MFHNTGISARSSLTRNTQPPLILQGRSLSDFVRHEQNCTEMTGVLNTVALMTGASVHHSFVVPLSDLYFCFDDGGLDTFLTAFGTRSHLFAQWKIFFVFTNIIILSTVGHRVILWGTNKSVPKWPMFCSTWNTKLNCLELFHVERFNILILLNKHLLERAFVSFLRLYDRCVSLNVIRRVSWRVLIRYKNRF